MGKKPTCFEESSRENHAELVGVKNVFISFGAHSERSACSQRRWLYMCKHAAHTCGLHMTSIQRTQPALTSSIPSPPPSSYQLFLLPKHGPSTYSVPGTIGSWEHKGNSSGASLCQPQGEGFPGRKPNLFAILSFSGVCGLLFAAWRQLYPARGQCILDLLIHSFLSILHPNFQF